MSLRSASRVCTLALLACAQMSLAGEEQIVLREGAGRDLVSTRCVICHSLDYVQANGPVMTRARWEATVRKMIDKFGAPITDDEAKAIVGYLGAHYAQRGT